LQQRRAVGDHDNRGEQSQLTGLAGDVAEEPQRIEPIADAAARPFASLAVRVARVDRPRQNDVIVDGTMSEAEAFTGLSDGGDVLGGSQGTTGRQAEAEVHRALLLMSVGRLVSPAGR